MNHSSASTTRTSTTRKKVRTGRRRRGGCGGRRPRALGGREPGGPGGRPGAVGGGWGGSIGVRSITRVRSGSDVGRSRPYNQSMSSSRLGIAQRYPCRRSDPPGSAAAVPSAEPGPADKMSCVDWPGVSVVMPVLNEEPYLAAAVGKVLGQDYPGELEVILAVGPSSDRTEEIAAELAAADGRVRVVQNPRARTPCALNLGFAAARHDVVVRVDGHGELTDGYVRRAVELLEETGAANVGGVMDARGVTPFEQAVAAAYMSRLGLGGTAFHDAEARAGEAETVFLGAFRKEAVEAGGGFDETMYPGQGL